MARFIKHLCTCATCKESFMPKRNARGKYCSFKCFNKRGQGLMYKKTKIEQFELFDITRTPFLPACFY